MVHHVLDVGAVNMPATDNHVGAGVVALAHVSLGLFYRKADRSFHLFNVVDAALLHPLGRGNAGAEHLEFAFACPPRATTVTTLLLPISTAV